MRVYLVGPASPEEYVEVAKVFTEAKHDPMWPVEASPTLKGEVRRLVEADAICLMDGWWTDRDCVALQTLAAWLRYKAFDPAANKVPTTSLRG